MNIRNLYILIFMPCILSCKQSPTIELENKLEKIVKNSAYNESIDSRLEINCDSINKILIEIYKKDQAVRNDNSLDIDSVDYVNQKKLISIINKCGFPTKKEVKDNRGMLAVFLTFQHSSPEIMAYYYPLIKESVDRGDIEQRLFGLYKDRLLISFGEKQLYGTQIVYKDGSNHLADLIDPKNVNERRLKIGLEPIEEYLTHFNLEFEFKQFR